MCTKGSSFFYNHFRNVLMYNNKLIDIMPYCQFSDHEQQHSALCYDHPQCLITSESLIIINKISEKSLPQRRNHKWSDHLILNL